MEGMLNGETINVARSPIPLAPSLLADYSEVAGAGRIRKSGTMPVSFADKEFIESGIIYADPAVFEVFTFPFIRGDAKTALGRPYTVDLTEGTARSLTQKTLRKFLKFDDRTDFAVSGVIRDVPNSI
jgi:putative ABC transport system permease protein